MKLGNCVGLKPVSELEGKFKMLTDEGFYSCQLVSWEPELWTDENARIIKTLADKYNVEISAFWCGLSGPAVWNFYEGPKTLGLLPAEYREARIKNLQDGGDFAKKFGVCDVVTHMGFIPENPNDPEFIPFCDAVRAVAEHLKKNGQWLLFETGQETPVAMLRCFEVVGTDNLGVNLDTANVILYGKANPVDALDVFGKYVRNLHAKDGVYPINGHNLGKEKPIGSGKVDFRGVFTKLKELGYDSYVTIEYELHDNVVEEVRRAKAYLENIISEVYGG